MRNLEYTYLLSKANDKNQKKLKEEFIKWASKQNNVKILEIKDKKIVERNSFQIFVSLNSKEDIEKAKNELQKRVKKHFKVNNGQIIYLKDKVIGQIYDENKSRPYFVLKSFTSNNKVVLLQITTKKHKNGVQFKIKLNNNISYIIIDEPLTLNKNDVYNARSELTKINQDYVFINNFKKYLIMRKFRKSFK